MADEKQPSDSEDLSLEKLAAADDDTAQLRSLGYEQGLKRAMPAIATLLFVCSNMSFYSIQSYIFPSAFGNGGSPAVIWGWVVVGFFAIIVAACLAEISSVYPTAGGPYYWAGALSQKGGSKLPSYIAGLFQLLAWIPGAASITVYGVVTMTNVLRSIRTDPAGAATLFTQSQVTGVGIGFSFCAFLFNCLPTRYFGWLTYVGGINLLVGVLATVVVLPAISPHQRLANDVFGNFVPNVSMHDYSADPAKNKGWTFCMALLPASFIISGFESPSHVSEETKSARTGVPRAIFGGVVITVALGLSFLLSLMFSIQDPTFSNGNSPTGATWPYATLYWDVFEAWRPGKGKGGATFFMVILMIANFGVMIFSHTSACRTVYAMARDGALPCSHFFAKLSSWGMPVHANALATVLEMCLILLNLVNQTDPVFNTATVAFGASTAYSIMGYYLSYFVPIMLRHTTSKDLFRSSPGFSLGRASLVLGAIACVWIIFIVIVSMWQQTFPITKQTLNWTAPGFGMGVFLTGVFWVAHARHTFRGPKRPDDDSVRAGHVVEAEHAAV